jgi:Mg-chelatase subunit ChlD
MLASFVRPASLIATFGIIATPMLAQTVVTGTVRDNNNVALGGASVSVRGGSTGVMTDDSGRYRLIAPDDGRAMTDSLTLLARRVGYEAVTKRIAMTSTANIDFVLKPATTMLESVVVTGTATTANRSLGSSVVGVTIAPAEKPARASLADAEVSRRDASRVARGRGGERQEPRPGVLTAASWDDAEHWSQYSRFLRRARSNSWNPWGLDVGQQNVRPVRRDNRSRSPRQALDVGFLVDATGSMGDEMTFLKSELKDIVRRVSAVEPELDIRVSVVFYRDRGDVFITKSLPFTRSVDDAVSFIAGTSAEGGGDYPEDMNAGLEAMMRQGWSRDAVPQMLFLLADAPPQRYPGTDYTYHEAIQDAAAKGIAIYPVAASGVDKPTEFLFRAMAVMTGGKYMFLTDDSGVGDSHEEPDISGYTVERLNDLMVREIRSYVAARAGGRRVAEIR